MEFMLMPSRCKVSPEQWDYATDLFELGIRNGRELALDLRVSPQTVSREMRMRGAKKGSRSAETVVDLDDWLDRKQRRAASMQTAAEHSVAQRRAAALAALNGMLKAILMADCLGDITLADETIQRTASAFGVSVRRTARR
jgi:hypothetical protein